jgi:DNA replication protein DnaC
LANTLAAYMRNWQENRRNGLGIILSGLNGTGKTCAAVWVGQEFRRWGQSVLFVSAADVRDFKFDGTWFSDDTTYWEWIREVDVLVLDDLGKGDDTSGFNQVMWDQLLRHRHDHRYVTIITTNLAISSTETNKGFGLDTALKKSTMEVLKENMLPLRINGDNRRDAAVVAIRKTYDA